jgi:hypothetical protein
MRVVVVVGLAGCWGSPQPPKPAPPVPTAATRSCLDAAVGLDRGTRSIRTPDAELIGPMRIRCTEDLWPAKAIDCFAQMGGGDEHDELGHCAGMLDAPKREKLFAALGGGSGFTDSTALALVKARLTNLQVGIPECDNFVIAVGRVLACSEYPLAARIQLGNETVDFWSLPTTKLPADAIKRMATVCDQSRGELEQRAVGAGCKL